MNDKTTIGITCYNAADTIVRAIESALVQDWPDCEVVVVDDCSTDDTWRIVQDLAKNNSDKIHVFQNDKNLGVAGTRNRIIAEARGEFLVFFDDDDVSLPDRISKQIRRIAGYERDFASGAAVICHAARIQKYPDGTEIIAPTMGCDTDRVAPHGCNMAARILYNKKVDGGDGAMPTCSQMARLSTYKNIGGFDEGFRRMEDTELNVRLALSGAHFVGIAEPLVIQTMTKANDKHIAAERIYARHLYKKHEGFLIKEGRGSFDSKWLEAKHDYWEGKKIKFISTFIGLILQHPILSAGRIIHAIPNVGYNRAVRKFHGKGA
jgi:glycosyltransferase involved in cell wall biosynthesis